MFNSSNVPSLSDIAAVTGNRNDNSFGDGNGWWVLIILFALFGGWGNNGWGNGGGDARPATQGDVQRGFDTQTVVSKLDGISNGICDGFYTMNSGMLNGFNTLQNSIQQGNFGLQNAIQQNTVANMQNTNAIATQLANCCCENREAIAQVRYGMATDTCAITTAINQATQNVMQNCNANYRALHGEFQERVLIHELGHCAIFSFNLQYDIHKGVKEEYWLEAEEWLCNFIAEYGQQIFETASSLEVVPQKVEEIVMNL